MELIQAGILNIYQLELGPVHTNCYIVMNSKTKDTIIVDPADLEEIIVAEIEKHSCNVKGIFLTHGHFDHIYAAVPLACRYRVSIYAGQKEEKLLSDFEMNCSTMINRPIEIEADEWLRDGQKVTIDSLSFQVIETPGHTKGSVCYYWSEDKVLLSGDTLFFESLGRTDLPTGSSTQILTSLKDKLMVLPDDTLVLPGHGCSTTIGYERKNNPYMEDNFWE